MKTTCKKNTCYIPLMRNTIFFQTTCAVVRSNNTEMRDSVNDILCVLAPKSFRCPLQRLGGSSWYALVLE